MILRDCFHNRAAPYEALTQPPVAALGAACYLGLQENMNHFTKTSLLIGFLSTVSRLTFAQVVYSENFDSGANGESLTDSQFGFAVHNTNGGGGNLRLGPAQHGWSGRSVTGSNADPAQINFLYKALALPTHGVVEFSADMFSATLTGSLTQDVGIQLLNGSPDAGGIGFELNAVGDHWQADNGFLPRDFWESVATMHNEPITGSIFWNQDTGEHWAEISDGSQTLDSPHLFDPELGPMTTIALYIDRRNSNVAAGDIDNLTVRNHVLTPEPFTMCLGGAGVGLFLKRRKAQRG